MTLITNEIHIQDSLNRSAILFTSDRRITRKGKYDNTKQKLFSIDYIHSGVSFFGLAEVFPNGRRIYLSDWLKDFINKQSDVTDLKMFSFRLKDAISEIVPSRILIENPSGFHLAGYNKEGFPDFFYFSNIGAFEDFIYKKIQPRYSNPESHFLDRDAKEQGWDGINPYSIKFITSWYRNGDIRAHVYAWKLLDYIFDNMFKFTDFKRPTTLEEYGKYVKFKLSMIGQICKKFSDTPLIGNSFDVLCIYKLNNTIQTQWIK